MLSFRGYRFPEMIEEMNRLGRHVERHTRAPAGFAGPCASSPLDIYDDGDSFVVSAQVPGVAPEDIDIEATTESLTLKGERKWNEVEGRKYHRREQGYGVFERTIELPVPIDADKISAKYDHGILEITMPKSEAIKPRKVEISVDA